MRLICAGDFLDPQNKNWDLPLNVLLEATLIGVRQAGLIMHTTGTKGSALLALEKLSSSMHLRFVLEGNRRCTAQKLAFSKEKDLQVCNSQNLNTL